MTTPKYGTNQQVAAEPGQSELMMLKIARKLAPDSLIDDLCSFRSVQSQKADLPSDWLKEPYICSISNRSSSQQNGHSNKPFQGIAARERLDFA